MTVFTTIQRKHAQAIYNPQAAHQYRQSDSKYFSDVGDGGKFAFVREAARSFSRPEILDMGCGTGRYFHCCENARSIVAFDLCRPMLALAKTPIGATVPVSLVQSSIDEIEFKRASFDLIYCMGVFGGTLPLTKATIAKVARWLKPDGMFAFDMIEMFLEPEAGTWRSRLAERVRPCLFGPMRDYVDAKLMKFTMDRWNLWLMLKVHFDDVAITQFEGRGRIDLLCVGEKALK